MYIFIFARKEYIIVLVLSFQASVVNATCKADPEDFTALSDELFSVVNVSAINTVVSIIMIMIQ